MAFDWTPKRERQLLRLFATMPAKAVAERMGCSENMVYLKANKLGFRKWTGTKLSWSEVEKTRLIGLYADTPNDELAEIFGRPLTAINQMARRLGAHKKQPANIIKDTARDFDVDVVDIAPGHRVVKFGDRHRSSHAQTSRSGPRGVSSLWNPYE